MCWEYVFIKLIFSIFAYILLNLLTFNLVEMNPNPDGSEPLENSVFRFIWEIFWLVFLGAYETTCFLILSAASVYTTTFLLQNPLQAASDKTWIPPLGQVFCAILILYVLTYLYDCVGHAVGLGSFGNRLKAIYPGLLLTVSEVASILSVFIMTATILAQFYQRSETLKERKSEGADRDIDVDFITSPIECFSKFGYQLLGICYQMLTILQFSHLVPADFFEALAVNSGLFVLGALYLSYFMYRTALKEIPFQAFYNVSNDHQTHWGSNAILAFIAYLSVFYFDLFVQPFLSSFSDLYLFGLAAVLAVIGEVFPWDCLTEIFPQPAEADSSSNTNSGGTGDANNNNNNANGDRENTDNDPKKEKDAISQYDYWVHAIFFFASLGLMTVLYFKTDLGWSFLIYEWEWETPTPCADQKRVEKEAVPIGPKKGPGDPRELGFILPEEPNTSPEEEKVPEDELCKIKHVANLAVVLFRTFTVIMLVSIARTVSAFKKLSVKG